MKFETCEIEGLLIIQPDVFEDQRGFFFESFNKKKYDEYLAGYDFIQDNLSKSCKNTIRGLHYQVGDFAQGKLCQVIVGQVLDIAVDIRFNSPTFGKYKSVILSSEEKNQFWIPPGFAHGFAVISDEAIFSYKCTASYSKKDERSILFNDPTLNINWEINDPVVSPKDLLGIPFAEIEKDFVFDIQEEK